MAASGAEGIAGRGDAPPAPAALQDMREIADLIAAFDASTARLKASHDVLQARIAELTGELSRKNEELSRTLQEVSALKNYLANILESITDGVLAIDLERRVVALNEAASEAIPDIASEREGLFVLDVLPHNYRELGLLLMRALCEEKRMLNIEMSFRGAGGEERTLSVSASPIRNEAGAVMGAVETFRDLTEIKRLQARAARQDRLTELGEMAAGVAHEIRNPLGGIELYASNLHRSLGSDTRQARLAKRIMAAATSLNQVVTDMLTFTRPRQALKRAVQVEQVVRSALEMAALELERRGVRIACDFTGATERVMLDPDLMVRAFLNVVLNAAQVMDEGEEVRIVAAITAGGAAGRELVVRFADQGPGIPPEAREKVFNPFFGLRKEGTGLGLAIVNQIVQQHGGSINIEDNRPRGTVFVFRLPAGEVPPREERLPPKRGEPCPSTRS